MRRIYKVIITLAISLGCASVFADGVQVVSTNTTNQKNIIEISSFDNTVTVSNDYNGKVSVYSLNGELLSSNIMVGGQMNIDNITGYYIVVIGNESQIVYIK